MLGSILAASCLLLAQADAPKADDPASAVRRLVRQLNAPELDRREAAEQQLIEL